MTYEQARKKFAAKVQELGGLEVAARALGFSVSHVSYLQRGERRPSPKKAKTIEEKWGIRWVAWFNDGKAA